MSAIGVARGGSIRGWITRSYAALPAVTRIATVALVCLELAHNNVLAERAADQMLARSLCCVRLGHCDGAGWVFLVSYKSVMTMLRENIHMLGSSNLAGTSVCNSFLFNATLPSYLTYEKIHNVPYDDSFERMIRLLRLCKREHKY